MKLEAIYCQSDLSREQRSIFDFISDGIKCYVHDMYIYLKEKEKSARAGFEPATNASIIVTELYTPLYQPS